MSLSHISRSFRCQLVCCPFNCKSYVLNTSLDTLIRFPIPLVLQFLLPIYIKLSKNPLMLRTLNKTRCDISLNFEAIH